MGGGCFVACFGSSSLSSSTSSSSNHKKRQNHTNNKVLPPNQRNGSRKPLQSNVYPKQDKTAKLGNLIRAKKNKHEEDLSLNTRKRVIFYSNVRTYEEVEALETDWTLIKSDYYAEDEDSESYDDINNERMAGQEINGLDKRERKTSVAHVHPVLNPVENLSQWKAAKMRHPPEETFIDQSLFDFKSKKYHQNQEISVDASLSNWLASSEITLKKKATVNGLEPISSERSISQGSTPEVSIHDTPILGALTMEELKEFSVSKSPRRSPSRRSLDDRRIIGTAGSYWRLLGAPVKDVGTAFSDKGLRNATTSKYLEISMK